MFVCLNGQFLKAQSVKISPFDHGFLYGDGVYETMRTYRGKPWQLDLHLKRLENSLKMAQIKAKWPLKKLILELLKKNNYPESRIRLMITRGESTTKGAVFEPKSVESPTLFITCYRIPQWKPGLPATGSCVFFHVERSFPEVKTTSIFPLIMARLYADSKKAADALLLDSKGYVHEGAVSNVFIVKKGKLITADSHILKGTTRDFVLKLAKKVCKVEFRSIKRADFFRADEIFITNAPRGIVAITSVQGRRIAKEPGPITLKLKQLFDAHHGHS